MGGGEMSRRTAIAAVFILATVVGADAMDFSWRNQSTLRASGPIKKGDAANFAALPKFDTLELDSPGGLVSEALAMAANMDKRGGVRTVVKPGGSCASACAMALFVSGETRVVYMGGRLGIHSCAMPDGTQSPECNTAMAANAFAHGVPWGVIEAFGNQTKPSDMLWLTAEDAECWGLMRWSRDDSSHNGIACFLQTLLTKDKRRPPEVTATNADYLQCRMNARTSRTYVTTGLSEQGFSHAYRQACEAVVADLKTPKYAAIDILMWLTLSDPNITALKPGTLMIRILGADEAQVVNCWKCLTVGAMSLLMSGHPKDAVGMFQRAVNVAKRETSSAPSWLKSRLDIAKAEAAKQR